MTISNVSAVRTDITQMLDRIRDISNKSGVFKTDHLVPNTADFSGVMKSTKGMLESINDAQAKTDVMKDKYLQGDPSVSLAQVVVSSEKSKLAFEGLIIVRNKCLDAYKEIMNMPV